MTEGVTSAAAERMRQSRERQRNGFRCFRVEIHGDEIDEMVRRGLVEPGKRSDHDAVALAVGELVGRVLAGVDDMED